ncbi:hypothetical protein KIPE111705_34660 [Kibdelosporangium persicum]|uniref:Uncharacterized protein n=1 Tax=Kibdelosporangium persicum TaxID=2698649 RepID=A0ABX2EZY4_9PSEU|nr:hypothetical protein [Kibdelosporangium persicum]NRN64584.1 hypothetical protein [Kibdelosporangium persicum]
MTTANTENEDLQGLVRPKDDGEMRPQGPVSHQTEPIDSSGGFRPAGPVSHQTEPADGDGDGTTQPDGPVSHQKTEPKPEPVQP